MAYREYIQRHSAIGSVGSVGSIGSTIIRQYFVKWNFIQHLKYSTWSLLDTEGIIKVHTFIIFSQ